MVVRRYDNKPVNVISSYVGVEPVDSVKRYDRSAKQHVQVFRPRIIKIYNTNMGSVDLLDMMTALYKPVSNPRGGMFTYGCIQFWWPM